MSQFECFKLIEKSKKPLTIKELAEVLNKNKSSITANISRLFNQGYLNRHINKIPTGKVYYSYTAKRRKARGISYW